MKPIEQQLQDALSREDYELAARLRDRIKAGGNILITSKEDLKDGPIRRAEIGDEGLRLLMFKYETAVWKEVTNRLRGRVGIHGLPWAIRNTSRTIDHRDYSVRYLYDGELIATVVFTSNGPTISA